ncbi:MAG: aldo/keto reductase [Candidatus Aminicenantes bacterium]|nr:aldo/keto reductase [Candidatus Aminicenantes bacterium]
MTSRRDLLKTAPFAAAAMISVHGRGGASTPRPGQKKDGGGLVYRRLGRTGLNISEVSLGGSPLPDWPLFLEIIERGVNYIDASVSYDNGNCERQIGKMLKTLGRDKAFVATKFHLREGFSEASIIASAETSLKRLQAEPIDVLLIHGAENPDHLTDERVLNAFEKLNKAGKFRFKGFSCHSNQAAMVRRAVDCGRYDMIQLGYNVFDIDQPEKDSRIYEDYLGESGLRGLLSLAASAGLGIVAMKTLKVGGRRQKRDAYRTSTSTLQQAMLKWVLDDRNVTSAVTEILNRTQMDEDLAVVGSPLTAAERRMLYAHVAENAADHCRGCAACRSKCPSSIPTTDILRALAYQLNYGKKGRARELWVECGGRKALADCLDCGTCERVCPSGLPVRRRLAEASLLLEA